eukprot:3480193-Pyramimonas_sp.AAC.1
MILTFTFSSRPPLSSYFLLRHRADLPCALAFLLTCAPPRPPPRLALPHPPKHLASHPFPSALRCHRLGR